MFTLLRFRDTITNHFYGHSHKDEFELYYSENGKEPVGVGFLGPSVTTYTNLNPGYRIYYVDGDRTNSSRVRAIKNIIHLNTDHPPPPPPKKKKIPPTETLMLDVDDN